MKTMEIRPNFTELGRTYNLDYRTIKKMYEGKPKKTHLAISLGITAAKARKSVYFITCHDLITQLNKAFLENKLDSKIKHFYKYELLIDR